MDVGFDEHGTATIAAAHLHGLLVDVWTVDIPERAVELASMGVDGVITDYPELTRQALQRASAGRTRPPARIRH
jgi:glycerophosphoryl diester phosphodiesterase